MDQRPIWRGNLRLALVSCPIALYRANHDRGLLHFNLINPKTGNRIRMITQDAVTNAQLSRSELVKGYEFKKDSYLILDDDDFESVRIESSTTIKIDKFIDGNSINPIYFDASYYLAPDGPSGEDVYVVLRDAIADTGKIALSRVVIARREHPIAIMTMGKGLVVHTLHEERSLNDYSGLFDNLPSAKADPEMIKLAIQLINRQVGRYDPSDVEDRYETRLRAVIDSKLRGEDIEKARDDDSDRTNVIDLMAALRKSLGETHHKSTAGKKALNSKSSAAKPKTAAKAKVAPGKSASTSRKAFVSRRG